MIIGIATRGRPQVLASTLFDLHKQTLTPNRIIVAYAEAFDIADALDRFPEVEFLRSGLGLTRQRNTILDACDRTSVVLFLDDDFHLHREYLKQMEQVFANNPDVVIATGTVLADGINGSGLAASDAQAMLASVSGVDARSILEPVFNAYGCNMCLRLEPIAAHSLRFDEDLPLYGWYEDVDFSRRLAVHGRVVQVKNALGVHLGTKAGRQVGVRLGYSQIANPFYLARKRSVSWTFALASMASRSAKNLVRSVAPEAYVDRRGRLRGNLRGWKDLMFGKISPTRILQM